jgi:hypothetical protein
VEKHAWRQRLLFEVFVPIENGERDNLEIACHIQAFLDKCYRCVGRDDPLFFIRKFGQIWGDECTVECPFLHNIFNEWSTFMRKYAISEDNQKTEKREREREREREPGFVLLDAISMRDEAATTMGWRNTSPFTIFMSDPKGNAPPRYRKTSRSTAFEEMYILRNRMRGAKRRSSLGSSLSMAEFMRRESVRERTSRLHKRAALSSAFTIGRPLLS